MKNDPNTVSAINKYQQPFSQHEDATTQVAPELLGRLTDNSRTEGMVGPMSGPDASVMIVEDEWISRKALASLLADHGYSIKAFESAEDLLAEVDRGTAPAVVLADVDLPGMNGLELLSHLERKYPDLYAIIITAADGETVDRFCRDHPCVYLPKPLNLSRLLSLLGETKTH